MSLTSFEVGIVSADRSLVDFLSDVFGLEELPPTKHAVGTLHRLQLPGAVVKVMVPREAPKAADCEPFLAVKGIRYLSVWTTDIDGVLERCAARGGSLVFGPFEYEPGFRLVVIEDPDGNTIEVMEARTPGDIE